jgi:hypothetical protein
MHSAQPNRWKRRAIATWIVLVGLLAFAFAAMFVLAATDPTDNIALSRNEVQRGSDGGRIWRGTFWNHTDSLYTDLDAVILFLDQEGRPVGQARGAARRLDPGEVFHLSAPLPPEAKRMQVYRLAWRSNGGPLAVLGPYRAWEFGYVTDQECGDLRLAIGSCAEQREQG